MVSVTLHAVKYREFIAHSSYMAHWPPGMWKSRIGLSPDCLMAFVMVPNGGSVWDDLFQRLEAGSTDRVDPVDGIERVFIDIHTFSVSNYALKMRTARLFLLWQAECSQA